jgi:hypothetical protein
MDACVIHDDDRIWPGEQVHDIQKSVNKTVELPGCVRVVFHRKVQNPVKGESRKDRVPRGLLVRGR